MFRAIPMMHLQAQVPVRDGALVTRRIASQGLLHLIDIAHGTGAASSAGDLDTLARFRELERRVRLVATALELPLADPIGQIPAPDVADFSLECDQLLQRFAPLEERVQELAQRLTTVREAAARLRTSLQDASRLHQAGLAPERLERLRFATIRLGYATPDDLGAIAGLLAPAPFAIVPLADAGSRTLAAVVAPASVAERLNTAVRASSFQPITIRDQADPPETIARRIADGERDEQAMGAELSAIRQQQGPALQEIGCRAQLAVLLLQAQTMFAASGRFLVVSGWIPETHAQRLADDIAGATSGRAVVSLDRPADLPAAYASALNVPILYRNPLLLRPFQRLVQTYGVPSYREVEPTAFFATSFLLMFGLMFGDVGHGLVLTAAGYCLFRYVPRFLDYAILLMEAGAASMVFGVLYGSLFGVERLLPTIWIHPIRDLPQFMGIAVGFGVLLVSAGLILNVWNSWRAGERVSALTGLRGLFGAFLYWTVVALTARALLPGSWVVPNALIFTLLGSAVALIAARPLILRRLDHGATGPPRDTVSPRWLGALEGSVELVDTIFSYFANTISFVRIAAFAAVHAGVFIAMFAVADTLAQVTFGTPLSFAALVAGNALIILLEGLTVTVQVLRLEYYEFFGKFFRGGGELYRPLMLRPNGSQGGL